MVKILLGMSNIFLSLYLCFPLVVAGCVKTLNQVSHFFFFSSNTLVGFKYGNLLFLLKTHGLWCFDPTEAYQVFDFTFMANQKAESVKKCRHSGTKLRVAYFMETCQKKKTVILTVSRSPTTLWSWGQWRPVKHLVTRNNASDEGTWYSRHLPELPQLAYVCRAMLKLIPLESSLDGSTYPRKNRLF